MVFHIIWLLPIIILVSFVILQYAWVIVTGYKRVKEAGKLTPTTKVLGYTAYVCGYFWDVWCNILCTIVFLDMIQEFTVSERLQRLVDGKYGWRRTLAIWFAVTLINPFDNDQHIELPTVQ